jgi:preprotein translocase subunit SecG
MSILLEVLLLLVALFLVLLILIQRGKGGGLAGAFGGLGGQSAFGTKAGDTFTRITIGVAALWIVLCLVTVRYLGTGSELDLGPTPTSAPTSPDEPPAAPAPAPADLPGPGK